VYKSKQFLPGYNASYFQFTVEWGAVFFFPSSSEIILKTWMQNISLGVVMMMMMMMVVVVVVVV